MQLGRSRVTHDYCGRPWSSWTRHKPDPEDEDEDEDEDEAKDPEADPWYRDRRVVEYKTYVEAEAARKAMHDSDVVVRQYRG